MLLLLAVVVVVGGEFAEAARVIARAEREKLLGEVWKGEDVYFVVEHHG